MKTPEAVFARQFFSLGAIVLVVAIFLSTFVLTGAFGNKRGDRGQRGVDGEPGPPGEAAPMEMFSIAMRDGVQITAIETLFPIRNWTDVVTCEDFLPTTLFQNLSYGTLDLDAGTYTVGLSGAYLMTFHSVWAEFGRALIVPFFNGNDVLGINNPQDTPVQFQVYLSTGDVVEMRVISINKDVYFIPPVYTPVFTPNTTCTYTLFWSMIKI